MADKDRETMDNEVESCVFATDEVVLKVSQRIMEENREAYEELAK